ncbi:MAG: IscS subfamily cysteine desulfurase [Pseudomonadales bacterium]
MPKPLYFDYAATTPVDPRVAQKMGACLMVEGNFGNPASRSHAFGWEAEEAVEAARAQVAQLLNADPREIVWTSGATESDNLAIKGIMEREATGHLVTSIIEHKAVLDTCAFLETQGYEVTYLQPDSQGQISPQQVTQALRRNTKLVSLMHVNNEIGVTNDIQAIGAVCREQGVIFHTDAAQSAGKLELNVEAMDVDLISISAHKMYGPKGAGALYVRREPPLHLVAQIHGGGHERGMRSGTLATHQLVGLGEASRIMAETMSEEGERILGLRERLWSHLRQIPDTVLHGHPQQRVAGILNVGFAGVDGETLLLALDDVAVSNGSACTSASVEPSYVLQALGVDTAIAHASLRMTIGRYTKAADVDHLGNRLADIVARLRAPRGRQAGA